MKRFPAALLFVLLLAASLRADGTMETSPAPQPAPTPAATQTTQAPPDSEDGGEPSAPLAALDLIIKILDLF